MVIHSELWLLCTHVLFRFTGLDQLGQHMLHELHCAGTYTHTAAAWFLPVRQAQVWDAGQLLPGVWDVSALSRGEPNRYKGYAVFNVPHKLELWIFNLCAFQLQLGENINAFMFIFVKDKLVSYLWWIMHMHLLKTTNYIVNVSYQANILCVDLI